MSNNINITIQWTLRFKVLNIFCFYWIFLEFGKNFILSNNELTMEAVWYKPHRQDIRSGIINDSSLPIVVDREFRIKIGCLELSGSKILIVNDLTITFRKMKYPLTSK